MKQFYLQTQLPELVFGQPPPMGVEEFLEEAEALIPSHVRILRGALALAVPVEERTGVLGALDEYERLIQDDIAEYRAAMREGRPYRGTVLASEDLTGNPLQVETRLHALRWQHVDELAGTHFADATLFTCFARKLGILAVLAMYQSEGGMDRYTTLLEALTRENEA